MLKFYRNLGIYVDKAVYLTIANAAGECGTSEEAIAIVEMVRHLRRTTNNLTVLRFLFLSQ